MILVSPTNKKPIEVVGTRWKRQHIKQPKYEHRSHLRSLKRGVQIKAANLGQYFADTTCSMGHGWIAMLDVDVFSRGIDNRRQISCYHFLPINIEEILDPFSSRNGQNNSIGSGADAL